MLPAHFGNFFHLGLDGFVARVSETEYLVAQPDLGPFGSQAACLRALPVAAFIADAHLVRTVPVIDGWAIPQPPAVLLAAGGAARIPVIEGSNLDDGGYFIARLESVGAPDAGRWIDLLRKAFGDAAAAEVASHYPIGAGTTPGARSTRFGLGVKSRRATRTSQMVTS